MEHETITYNYKMPDRELDLVFQFKMIFDIKSIEYYKRKEWFLNNTLQDRVCNYKLNKCFYLIMDYFEAEILFFGEDGKYIKGFAPFEELYINRLTDWFFDRIMIVILLYLTSGKFNLIILLTKDGWHNKLSYGKNVENISITSKRIPEEISTEFTVDIYL